MRYFILKDETGNASGFFRFDSTGDAIVEERWVRGKWSDDKDMLVSQQLMTGEGKLVEVSKKEFDKWFPGSGR